MKFMVGREIKEKGEQVCEDFDLESHPAPCPEDKVKNGITYRQLEAWVEHFGDEDFVETQRQALAKLESDVFEKQKIEEITFDDMPEDLDSGKYLLMYKKIWATIRHDLWKEIRDRKAELRVTELDEKEFDKLYNSVHKRFESIRVDIYRKIMDVDDIEPHVAKKYMQQAYVQGSTLSSTSKVAGAEATASKWPDLVQKVAIDHGKLIQEMAQGKFYPNIDKDPRDNPFDDEKLDLKSMDLYKPGFSSQKTMIADDKVNVKPVSKGAEKYVKMMLDKAQEAKKRVADRHAAAGTTPKRLFGGQTEKVAFAKKDAKEAVFSDEEELKEDTKSAAGQPEPAPPVEAKADLTTGGAKDVDGMYLEVKKIASEEKDRTASQGTQETKVTEPNLAPDTIPEDFPVKVPPSPQN